MLHNLPFRNDSKATGRIVDGVIVADGVTVADIGIVERVSERDGPDEIGALCQGLVDLGVAAYRVTDTDRELRRVEDATSRFEVAVEATVEQAVGTVTDELATFIDPEKGLVKESVSRELERIIDGLDDAFDPDDKKSILSQIETVVTDAGVAAVEDAVKKMRKLVDPSDDNSPMGKLRSAIVRDLREPLDQVADSMDEMEKLISIERAVAVEADRGTAKGLSYEDQVGAVLGECAVSVGDEVARTSEENGHDGTDVGDYVTTADANQQVSRIAWEAKDRKALTRAKALAELNETASNRDASVAVMVISHDGKLTNGAPLVKLAASRYVVVYDKNTRDDLAVKVMYQMARLEAIKAGDLETASIDAVAIAEKITEARTLLDKVSTIKGDLTSAERGINGARAHIEEMKTALLERLEELSRMVSP